MRAATDCDGLEPAVASTSRLGRFDALWPTRDANRAASADLSGAWIVRFQEILAAITARLPPPPFRR